MLALILQSQTVSRQAKYTKYLTVLLCMACPLYPYLDPVVYLYLVLDPVPGYRFDFGSGPAWLLVWIWFPDIRFKDLAHGSRSWVFENR